MLFFKPLVKKTKQIQFTELRYKQLFWNKIMIDLPLKETHKLDYIADSWIIAQISSAHKHLVYDTATMLSYNEYLNQNAVFLRIKQMTHDFNAFPGMKRNHEIVDDELWRVVLNKKCTRNDLRPKFKISFSPQLFATKYYSIQFFSKLFLIKARKYSFKKLLKKKKKPKFLLLKSKKKKIFFLQNLRKKIIKKYS